MIQDGDFKDAVIDALIASVATVGKEDKYWYPSGERADRVYNGTPPGSPLRRLLVDMHIHHGRRDWVQNGANPDFLTDLVRDLLDLCDVSNKGDPARPHISSCLYHHHGYDAQCYSEKDQRSKSGDGVCSIMRVGVRILCSFSDQSNSSWAHARKSRMMIPVYCLPCTFGKPRNSCHDTFDPPLSYHRSTE